MTHDGYEVDAVLRRVGQALLENGELIAVTNWFDADGDECGCHVATGAVVGPDSFGRWYAIDLACFEPTKAH